MRDLIFVYAIIKGHLHGENINLTVTVGDVEVLEDEVLGAEEETGSGGSVGFHPVVCRALADYVQFFLEERGNLYQGGFIIDFRGEHDEIL